MVIVHVDAVIPNGQLDNLHRHVRSHRCALPLVGSWEAVWSVPHCVFHPKGSQGAMGACYPQAPRQSSGNMAMGRWGLSSVPGPVEKNTGLAVWLLRLPIWETVPEDAVILSGQLDNLGQVWFSPSGWLGSHVAYAMLCFFPIPSGSQEAMCAQPSPGVSRLFLKKNLSLHRAGQGVLPICLFKTAI
jgi:hypothetical protein